MRSWPMTNSLPCFFYSFLEHHANGIKSQKRYTCDHHNSTILLRLTYLTSNAAYLKQELIQDERFEQSFWSSNIMSKDSRTSRILGLSSLFDLIFFYLLLFWLVHFLFSLLFFTFSWNFFFHFNDIFFSCGFIFQISFLFLLHFII